MELLLERFSDTFTVHVLDAGAKRGFKHAGATYIQGDIRVRRRLQRSMPLRSGVQRSTLSSSRLGPKTSGDRSLQRAIPRLAVSSPG